MSKLDSNHFGLYDLVIRGLTFLGMFAVLMFLLGYTYASIPLVTQKTCTPSFIDRILK
jgi:hypothetical protein